MRGIESAMLTSTSGADSASVTSALPEVELRVDGVNATRCHVTPSKRGGHEPQPPASAQGWYFATGSFPHSHLPNELVYDEHYRLAIFVRPSRCVEEECDAARNFLGPKKIPL